MKTDVKLSCQCGNVRGLAQGISPRHGTRVICYCRSCQKFPQHLGSAERVLDAHGGTDIYQLAPQQVRITQGAEHIRCLRWSAKGLHRWYAGCCNAPIGNTVSAKFPFIGIIHSFIQADEDKDKVLGPVRCLVNVPQELQGELPKTKHHQSFPVYTARLGGKLLSWKIFGKGKPNPLYDEDGQPCVAPETVFISLFDHG